MEKSLEALLEEAKQKYPMGTIVECLSVERDEKIISDLEILGFEIIQSESPYTRVYSKGHWAQIISTSNNHINQFENYEIY